VRRFRRPPPVVRGSWRSGEVSLVTRYHPSLVRITPRSSETASCRTDTCSTRSAGSASSEFTVDLPTALFSRPPTPEQQCRPRRRRAHCVVGRPPRRLAGRRALLLRAAPDAGGGRASGQLGRVPPLRGRRIHHNLAATPVHRAGPAPAPGHMQGRCHNWHGRATNGSGVANRFQQVGALL
jgi:hypothetical protein